MALTDTVRLILTADDKSAPAFRGMIANVERATKSVDLLTTSLHGLQSASGAVNLHNITTGLDAMRVASANATKAVQAQIDAIKRLNTTHINPPKAPTTPTTPPSHGGSGHGGIGGGLVGGAIAGAGATLGYYALSAAGQAFGDSLAYQRQSAVTQATTGMTPDQFAAMQAYIQKTAASGTQPYSALTLAQGAYPIASVGVTDPASLQAIMRASIMASAASGAPDVATTSDALVTAMHSMGIAQKDFGRMAMPTEDILMTAVNRGKVDPTQVPGAFSRFVGLAGNKNMSLQDAAGLFTADTLTSPSALQSGQNMASLLRAVTAPSQAQLRAASFIPGASQLLGPDVFKHMDVAQWLTQMAALTKGHEGSALPRLLGQADAANLVMNAIGPGGSKLQNTLGILQQEKQGGSTAAAFGTYEQSSAAKLDNAATQFNAAVQTFMAAATPLETAMIQLTTQGIGALMSVLAGPGGKGGIVDSVYGAGRTLGHYLDPTDPGFLNKDRSAQEAAQDLQNQRANAAARVTPAVPIVPPTWHQLPSSGKIGTAIPHSGQWTDDRVPGQYFPTAAAARAAGDEVIVNQMHDNALTTGPAFHTQLLSGYNAGPIPHTVTTAGPPPSPETVGRSTPTGPAPAYGTADWASFNAYYGSPTRPRGGPKPDGGVGDALLRAASSGIGGALSWATGAITRAATPATLREVPTLTGGPGNQEVAGRAPDPAPFLAALAKAQAQAVQAAQTQLSAAMIQQDSARIHHASTQVQLADANKTYGAAIRLAHTQGLTGLALTDATNKAADQRDATIAAVVQQGLTPLQQTLQLATLKGNVPAEHTAVNAILAYEKAHPDQFSATQQAIDKITLNQQFAAAKVLPGPQLIRPNVAGLGAPIAGFGASVAKLDAGPMDTASRLLSTLQAQLARAETTIRNQAAEIAELRQHTGYLRSIDKSLGAGEAKGKPANARNLDHMRASA